MKHTAIGIALALACALTACGPLGVVAGGPAPAASKKPKAADEPKKPPPPAVPSVRPTAAGLLGKMKEPLALARQAALVTSLHDVLPISMASGGLAVLNDATSLVSNNGGSVVANNGGGLITDNGAGLVSDKGGAVISDHGGGVVSNGGAAYRTPFGLRQLVQEPGTTSQWERRGLVMTLYVEDGSHGTLSMYDATKWDRTPGANNEAALVDRFDFEVENIRVLPDDVIAADFKMTIVISKRIPFVDELTVRQHTKLDDRGGHVLVKLEYLLGFDVALADGSEDRADLLLVAEKADLQREVDARGRELPGTEMPARMSLGGSNGHGTYEGEVRFPRDGSIDGAFTHARPDGAKTAATFLLRADGSATHAATSENGKLAVRLERGAAAGSPSFEVRDLAGATPSVLPDVTSEEGGIATFDFGTPEKARARVF